MQIAWLPPQISPQTVLHNLRAAEFSLRLKAKNSLPSWAVREILHMYIQNTELNNIWKSKRFGVTAALRAFAQKTALTSTKLEETRTMASPEPSTHTHTRWKLPSCPVYKEMVTSAPEYWLHALLCNHLQIERAGKKKHTKIKVVQFLYKDWHNSKLKANVPSHDFFLGHFAHLCKLCEGCIVTHQGHFGNKRKGTLRIHSRNH